MSDQTWPKRSEIPVEETWDLTRIFETHDAYRKSIEACTEEVARFVSDYATKLSDLDTPELIAAYKRYENISNTLSDGYSYLNCMADVDLSNSENAKNIAAHKSLTAKIYAQLSFFEGALMRCPKERIEAATKDPYCGPYFEDILRRMPHYLSDEKEELLALLGPTLSFPMEAYETTKALDTPFSPFEAAGKSYPLSYVLYENSYAVSDNKELRRKSFAAFCEGLKVTRNSIACDYNAQVQKEKILATLRGFDSVIDYLLFDQKVDRELYDRQIDVIMEHFAPVMRRYATLLKKRLGLEEIYFSDLRANLFSNERENISLDEAAQYIEKAVAPMGQDYSHLVMRYQKERWVDFAMNQGKVTGGYCGSSSQGHPYVLLSWNGTMSELYTLAHELGHGANFVLGAKNNCSHHALMPMYLIEAPSTFHELLLSHARLQEAQNENEKDQVYADMLAKTYYHNFVTHLLEAHYQREVYRLVDEGQQLGADDFDRLMMQTLKAFWGDAVVIEEGAKMTWMRQPHYYMGLYSYSYSAGLTIATKMFLRLQNEPEAAAKDWLRFLAYGDRGTVREMAQIGGVDLKDDRALRETIDFLSDVVAQLEAKS